MSPASGVIKATRTCPASIMSTGEEQVLATASVGEQWRAAPRVRRRLRLARIRSYDCMRIAGLAIAWEPNASSVYVRRPGPGSCSVPSSGAPAAIGGRVRSLGIVAVTRAAIAFLGIEAVAANLIASDRLRGRPRCRRAAVDPRPGRDRSDDRGCGQQAAHAGSGGRDRVRHGATGVQARQPGLR